MHKRKDKKKKEGYITIFLDSPIGEILDRWGWAGTMIYIPIWGFGRLTRAQYKFCKEQGWVGKRVYLTKKRKPY